MGQPAAQAVGAVVTDFCDKIRSSQFAHRRTNMSASPADEQQEPTRAKSFRLPPMFGPIENGQRTAHRHSNPHTTGHLACPARVAARCRRQGPCARGSRVSRQADGYCGQCIDTGRTAAH
jgi:hypothetical protein